MPTFDPNPDHEISLTTASEWTKNYRDSVPSGSTIAHYFSKSYLQDIFDQSGCVGIRIYYANDDNGDQQLVITGVDGNGDDLNQAQGILAERGTKTPPFTFSPSPLNS